VTRRTRKKTERNASHRDGHRAKRFNIEPGGVVGGVNNDGGQDDE
jgi:hypothetical protein